jgi:hypothetical protein
MRLTFRDGLATVFVAAAAAVYIPWVTGAALTGWPVRVTAAAATGAAGLGSARIPAGCIRWAVSGRGSGR